jgi:hypothetical protein
MSNPLVSNLLQTNVASTASRSPAAERTTARDDSDTGQDFATALGRRIGNESGRAGSVSQGNAPEQASRRSRNDHNDDVQPRRPGDAHDDGPRVARRPTREAESSTSGRESKAPQDRSQPGAPSASEGESRSDAARSNSAPQSPVDDTNSSAPAAKDDSPADVATQAANTDVAAAAAATDNAASAEAQAATQLPADTAAAANLAALLQGLVAQLPAAQPPQPGSGTTDGQTGTLPDGHGSSSHVLSTVLATLQRDGLGQPMTTGGKDDAAVATGTAAAGKTGPGFAVPTKELAEPTALSRSAQNTELLRSASAPDSAANTPVTPAPQSQLASTDGQALGLQLANLTPAARSEATHVPQLPVHTQAGQAAWAEGPRTSAIASCGWSAATSRRPNSCLRRHISVNSRFRSRSVATRQRLTSLQPPRQRATHSNRRCPVFAK